MSTIMKALRRLEQDRDRQAREEKLHGEVVAPAITTRARRSRIVVGLAASIVGAAVVGAYFAYSGWRDDSGSSAAPADEPVLASADADAVVDDDAQAKRQLKKLQRRYAEIADRTVTAPAGDPATTVDPTPVVIDLPVPGGTSIQSRQAARLEHPKPALPRAPEPERRAAAAAANERTVAPAAAPRAASKSEPARRTASATPAASASAERPEATVASRPAAPPPPTRSKAATTAAAPPTITVVRTEWHPTPARRIVHVAVDDGARILKLHEGDAYGDLVISEIGLSSVVFDRGGESISRRVGEGG